VEQASACQNSAFLPPPTYGESTVPRIGIPEYVFPTSVIFELAFAASIYGFCSVATDLVGNIELPKITAENKTTVQGASTCAPNISSQITIARGGFRFNHATNSFVQKVTLTNGGTAHKPVLNTQPVSPRATDSNNRKHI
jgi:hypothetical protein